MLKLSSSILMLCLAVLPVIVNGAELEVIARYAIPGEPSPAVDVRWADGHSVFLVRAHDGVWQLSLDEALTPGRQWMPSTSMLGAVMGDHPYTQLATTGDFVAVLRLGWQLAWRRAHTRTDRTFEVEKYAFTRPMDLDVRAGRIAILGAQDTDQESRETAIWVGSFAQDLEDLRPLGNDANLSPLRDGSELSACWPLGLGAVRWLDGGRLLVVPGFAPGAYLLSASGRLLEAWDDEELGTDTAAACATLTTADKHRLLSEGDELRDWRNGLTIVDDLVPLPSGPAVLIRTTDPASGMPSWQLRRLGATNDLHVPIDASTPDDRLRADVRGDRILLLRYAGRPAAFESGHDGELVVLRMTPRQGA